MIYQYQLMTELFLYFAKILFSRNFAYFAEIKPSQNFPDLQ